MGHQANTATQAIARVDGKLPDVSVAAGRKGFKAELDDLRERMRKLGLGYDEIAGEIARRYRLRPRESFRLAWGWSLNHAAARFNALAAQAGTDPHARAGMTGPHLCEYERWPSGGRKPSVYLLLMLAQIYETDVLCLLDLPDHESLAPQDRLALIRPVQPRSETPFGQMLVALLEARGLSLREAARRARCSAGYLSNVTHGRKRASEQLAARLDDLLEAGGELAALAEIAARADEPAPRGYPRGLAREARHVSGEGLSLWLPYVPARLVVEVSGPVAGTGQLVGGDRETVSGGLALVRDAASARATRPEVTGR
jgi:transcriptional regulator with XRE-family HTH domain